MHPKLTKHGKICMQNNQLLTKTLVELIGNCNTYIVYHLLEICDLIESLNTLWQGLVSALHCVETRLLPLLLLADPTRNPVASLQEQCVVLLQVQPEYKYVISIIFFYFVCSFLIGHISV